MCHVCLDGSGDGNAMQYNGTGVIGLPEVLLVSHVQRSAMK